MRQIRGERTTAGPWRGAAGRTASHACLLTECGRTPGSRGARRSRTSTTSAAAPARAPACAPSQTRPCAGFWRRQHQVQVTHATGARTSLRPAILRFCCGAPGPAGGWHRHMCTVARSGCPPNFCTPAHAFCTPARSPHGSQLVAGPHPVLLHQRHAVTAAAVACLLLRRRKSTTELAIFP